MVFCRWLNWFRAVAFTYTGLSFPSAGRAQKAKALLRVFFLAEQLVEGKLSAQAEGSYCLLDQDIVQAIKGTVHKTI